MYAQRYTVFSRRLLRKSPQLLGKVSQPYDFFPSCWGRFRTPTISSPAAGERFVPLRFPPQLLGNVSRAAISSPVAGERFARRDFLPSCWGTFRTPTISSPAAGERFARRDFLPSCWGTFRTPRFFPQLLGNLNTIFYILQRNCAASRGRRCISNRGRDPGRSLFDIGRRDSGRRRSPEGLRCCKSGSRRPL